MEPHEVRYPELVLRLAERNLNAFGLIGRTRMLLHREGVSDEDCAEFVQEMEDSLTQNEDPLDVVTRWVTVQMIGEEQ